MASAAEIQKLATRLPRRSRLKLAAMLLRESSPAEDPAAVLDEATRRDAEWDDISPLSEPQFWRGVKHVKRSPGYGLRRR